MTFFYNGGPGSATVWLHMARWGRTRPTGGPAPARRAVQTRGQYRLAARRERMVFIDMPGTGFGRLGKDAGKAFWGVDQDANAFARFIQRFSAGTAAGTRPSTSSARATARRARRSWPSGEPRASILTA